MIRQCSSCEDKLCEMSVGLVEDFQISASKKLFESSGILKHKVVNMAKFFVYKYVHAAKPEEDTASNEFVEEFRPWESLCAYAWNCIFCSFCCQFVWKTSRTVKKLQKLRCYTLFNYQLNMTQNKLACHPLKNISFKPYALNQGWANYSQQRTFVRPAKASSK